MREIRRLLIIQTAFLGDAILATGLIEKLKSYYPDAEIDFLVRKGNEGIFKSHPVVRNVLILDKSKGKLRSLWELLGPIRSRKYDLVVNCHRYWSSGMLTVFSGSKYTVGFDKNPLSFLFSKRQVHAFDGSHEIERNHKLVSGFTDDHPAKPKLYPPEVPSMFGQGKGYITISPASVWHTKEVPSDIWVRLIDALPNTLEVVLLGGPADKPRCESIKKHAAASSKICILAGRLSLLESAQLMTSAVMNYVNDSAPMHLASAVDAPVCAVYCSTVPQFGFGPLSTISYVVQAEPSPACKPCGIHGHTACPKVHYECGNKISVSDLLKPLNDQL